MLDGNQQHRAGGGVIAPRLTPERFFADLFDATEYNVNLRAIDSSRKLPVKETFVRGTDEIIKWAEEHGTSYDCYFGVATRDGSGTKEAIRELVVVHVDVDFKNTPREKADNLLAGFPLSPTYKVASGGGYHLYWLLEEPAEREDINRIEAINRGLAKLLGGDLASCDASRILRIPGTPNRKPDYGRPSPIVAIVEGQPAKRYTLSAFDDYADVKKTTTPPAGPVKNQIPDGKRNTTLTSLAGSMRYRGMTVEAIEAALIEENRTKCSPPLPESEVRAIARSVSRYPSVTTFHLTDLGNAKRLVARFKDRMRYCSTWKCWLFYDGTRWMRDDTGEIFRLAKQTVEGIYGEAQGKPNEDQRKDFAKHAMLSESEKRIKGMIALAQSEEGVTIRPAELDRHKFKLNVLNGTINTREAKLYPHEPDDLITQLAPVTYDEEADAPRWKQFLQEVFLERRALIDFMHRFLGYCLTGDTKEQAFVIGHGDGGNGKSVLLSTVTSILGDYAASTPFSTFMVRRHEGVRNDLACLHSVRLVTSSEAAEDMRFDEELLKRLTGDETIKARFLFSEYFEYEPRFKLFLATNHRPRIRGTDHAIWRRIRLVPFDGVFTGPNRDPDLKDKLLAESAGILAWLVTGAMLWNDMGLGDTQEIRQATEQYQKDEDILGSFINDCCELDPFSRQQARPLYLAFKEYCGGRAMSEKAFSLKMTKKGFEKDKLKTGTVWNGIALLSDRKDNHRVHGGQSG